MVEAHLADGPELGAVAGAVARAFHDDPVMTWLFGDDDARRLRRLHRFFPHEARRHRRQGEVLTTAGHEGGAFWDPPGKWKTPWWEVLRSLPVMVPAVGPRLRRGLRGLELIERAHPREPHWYLAVVGTDPAHRGKGVGAALIDPVVARCDATGTPAYLESSKADNVPYYERFGFTVTGQIDLPKGPPLWPMWRDPR
jgi:GNAT superfamily N-acetyltransferase